MSGLPAFSAWVNRVHDQLEQERGWRVGRVAKEAKVSRSLLANWRKEDFSQGEPQRKTVYKMCANLGIPMDEPFAIFGWDPDGPAPAPEKGGELLTADPREWKIRAVLRDPDLLDFERARYEAVLDMVIADHEKLVEQREQEG